MSAPPNFTDFEFHRGQGVPSNWTAAHARSSAPRIDGPEHTSDGSRNRSGSDKTARLSKVTGVEAATLRGQRASVFRRIRPFIRRYCNATVKENVVRSPTFRRDLSALSGEFWLAASDPVSSDADTGPSDVEDDGQDIGFGADFPPADVMDVDTVEERVDEEWVVEEEMVERERVVEEIDDMPAARAARTLAGLVEYGASDDDASGEDEEEIEKERTRVDEEARRKKIAAGKKKEKKGDDADDEREEDEEFDQLEGGQESDGAGPPPNVKGYTRTGWPTGLNQRLRQGKSQPAMREKMLELVEEGLLEPAGQKCDRCRGAGGRRCLLPVDSDNGKPSCAECLISSHGCPNRVARATPARKKSTRSSKGKAKAGPALVKRPQAFVVLPRLPSSNRPPAADPSDQQEAGPSTIPSVADFLVEYTLFSSRPQQARPPPGHGEFSDFEHPVADFAFNLSERCAKGMTHPREAAWDRILASAHQLIASHRALEYELRRHGPFTAEEIEYLLQTCYPDSMHPEDVVEENGQGNRDA
ncbi:uncharacterized protein ARMOST_04270 [Armillaria ostoyae]|uniref:Uncharacterized protein n=1 Tax=Armillaria ostoyae TaxID=47428 RepID=A0A284QWX1_ARMOS|nr:uncharacterized protein ARMOST_04270 [Armillaria ostoyae]